MAVSCNPLLGGVRTSNHSRSPGRHKQGNALRRIQGRGTRPRPQRSHGMDLGLNPNRPLHHRTALWEVPAQRLCTWSGSALREVSRAKTEERAGREKGFGRRTPRRLTNWRFSCEPQRLRGPAEAPKFHCQTLPEADWSALWLVSCNRLLGGVPQAFALRCCVRIASQPTGGDASRSHDSTLRRTSGVIQEGMRSSTVSSG